MMLASNAEYCDYFGFTRDPFSIAPDPSLLHISQQYTQALAQLKYGLERQGGFILFTGEVGTGKTITTRFFLQQLPKDIVVVQLFNSQQSTRSLLTQLCRQLEVELEPYKDDFFTALSEHLSRNQGHVSKTLVVIEEAQNLGAKQLEAIRLLTNIETNTKKLLHVLLVGQPELLKKLDSGQHRQLKQRVISRINLRPLNYIDTQNYVNCRLNYVGCKQALFNDRALKALFSYSGGIPRLLNLIAERSLLNVYFHQQISVNSNAVKKAAIEVLGSGDETSLTISLMTHYRKVVAVTCFSVLFLSSIYFTYKQSDANLLSNKSLKQISETGEIKSDLAMTTAFKDQKTYSIEPSIELDRQRSAIQGFLNIWNLDASIDVDLETKNCDKELGRGLRCLSLVDQTLRQIATLNRSGLVTLLSTSTTHSNIIEGHERYAILLERNIRENTIILKIDGKTTTLSKSEFEAAWQKDFLTLWRMPEGYRGPLGLGDLNKPLVGWLQSQLRLAKPNSEELITGGRYSAALVERVKDFQGTQGLLADGVVGINTIIKLNSILADR